MIFAAGTLWAKYRVDAFQDEIHNLIEERSGAQLAFDDIQVAGPLSVRVNNVSLLLDQPEAPLVRVTVPSAYVTLNPVALFKGTMTIQEVSLDHARIVIERSIGGRWLPDDMLAAHESFAFAADAPFRLSGENCQLELRNVVGETQLPFEGVHFDVARLAGQEEVTANCGGLLRGDEEKRLRLNLRVISLEDFELRLESIRLAAEDVNALLPGQDDFVLTGTSQPNVRVWGYPGRTLMVAIQAPFEDLVIRDQPDFIRPASGELNVFANYNVDERRFMISTANADSDQISGDLSGEIVFANERPTFDLRLESTRLPATEMLNYALEGRFDDFGAFGIAIQEPYQAVITLTGASEEPSLEAHARADSGEISLLPSDVNQPQGRLGLGEMKVAWDSNSRSLSGTLNVLGGNLRHEPSGMELKNISGAVLLEDGLLSASAVMAEFIGNQFVGNLSYDYTADKGSVSFTGVCGSIDRLPFADNIEHATFGGSATLDCQISKDGRRYTAKAAIDATQTEFAYEWWLHKVPGVSASGTLKAEYRPHEAILLEFDGNVASSPVHATSIIDHAHDESEAWRMKTFAATADTMDVETMGRCLKIPYTVHGPPAKSVRVAVVRDDRPEVDWRLQASGQFDEVTLRYDESDTQQPMRCTELDVEVTLESGKEDVGAIRLTGAEGDMPPLRNDWLGVLRAPEHLRDVYPPGNRYWTFVLAADRVSVPPWEGTNFTANAYSDRHVGGFNFFRGDIGDGSIRGTYHTVRADNTYTFTSQWEQIPSDYILEHLGTRPVFTGLMTGKVQYSMDQDDPSTLKGKGFFELDKGKFNSDFVLDMLQEETVGDIGSLTQQLEFSTLRADVEFENDVVRTPSLSLVSKGLRANASGHFVRDGDMDYDVRVSVAPDIAARIPALNENLPIEGHRMSQQNIDLGFRVTGPTFRPRGQVAKLPPASVTLVSGALEVTSEALRVIDAPRRILVDLLKIGGGLVGATANN